MTSRDPTAGSSRGRRPHGIDDKTVAALGKLSEALEMVERARGHLYSFHQLIGGADKCLGDAVDQLGEAGHEQLADRLRTELIGLNVLDGRWTFQVVEEFDDGYWTTFRDLEQHARDTLAGGIRHVLEAEVKESNRTPGRPGHAPAPPRRDGAADGP
ncbi:hypothetical protein HT102_09840 [Hoyosella sp. G463]|uniref:Uncharacterized protein n=1 Tax=Lolliginicoccus lacisalsi TaxID=2742202 RepID=A0A927JCV5_9ACTN|nr:hypothetical protein [Lolliginicoccus lacisalsi]MBD8506788.1 hypothetical protein [Lolliginicoccus lacisalsi]